MVPAFGGRSFPPKNPISRRKKSCVAKGDSFYSPFVCGVPSSPFSSSLLFLRSFNQYFLSIYYVLDTILDTGDIARNSTEEAPDFLEFLNKQLRTYSIG